MPDISDAFRQAEMLLAQNQPTEAATLCLQALAEYPDDPQLLFLAGLACLRAKDTARGLEFVQRSLEKAPENVSALLVQGIAQQEMERFQEAVVSYDRALALTPAQPTALLNRGISLLKLGCAEEALASWERLLNTEPAHPKALYNTARALQNLERRPEALAIYERLIAVEPNHIDALSNMLILLQAENRPEDALRISTQILDIQPGHIPARYARRVLLYQNVRLEDALADVTYLLRKNPDEPEFLADKGVILVQLARFDEAMSAFESAIARKPDYAQARYNRALLLLMQGQLSAGWPDYELRFGVNKIDLQNFSSPRWAGQESLSGKTIFLYAEQGFGDSLQFCRYVDVLADKGATVFLGVPASIKNLAASLRGCAQVFSHGEPVPFFDYHCPLLSLPQACQTTLENIPAAVPYLYADAGLVADWKFRLGVKKRPRIGLVWSGKKTSANDFVRNIPLATLKPLLERFSGHVDFCVLHKEFRFGEEAELKHLKNVTNFGASLSSFSDTAALLEHVDLLLTVDTSVVHLAGALGRPAWLFLPLAPDFRWLLDRDDSPWYPSVRLFRQKRVGDWPEVVSRVEQELEAVLARSGGNRLEL